MPLTEGTRVITIYGRGRVIALRRDEQGRVTAYAVELHHREGRSPTVIPAVHVTEWKEEA